MALRNLAARESFLANHSRLLTEAIYSWQMTPPIPSHPWRRWGCTESQALCALLDAGRIALVEVDGKRQVSRWSAAAERISAGKRQSIIGRNIAVLAGDR